LNLPWEGPVAAGALTAGLRASALHLQARPGDAALAGVAELAEISGSDTFVHLSTPLGAVVAQLVGVHYFELGAAVTMHFSPQDVYLIDAQGALLRAPVDVQRGAARGGA
jgi:glycerol transport system ATP-binding protein